MVKTIFIRKLRPLSHWAILLIILTLALGCQPKAPSLCQKAAARVKKVKGIVADMAAALADPVAQENIKKVNAILKESFAAAGQEAGLPLRRVGVTDNLGVVLTDYPLLEGIIGIDVSTYISVATALQNHKIGQERLFLENKLEVFVICAPLLSQGKVVGTVWLAWEAEKVREAWGISTEEFLGVDFNK